AAYSLWAEHVMHVFWSRRTKEALSTRRADGLFRALRDAFRYQVPSTALKQILFVQNFHLQRRWECGSKFNDAVVEKREAPFDRVRHCHAVALRGEDVSGKQVRSFQVLGSRETIPPDVVLRQHRLQFGVYIRALKLTPERVGEEHLHSRCQ